MRCLILILTTLLLTSCCDCFTKGLFNSVKTSFLSTADSLKSSVDVVKTSINDLVGHIHTAFCTHDKDEEKGADVWTEEPLVETTTTQKPPVEVTEDINEWLYDIDVRGAFRRSRQTNSAYIRVAPYIVTTQGPNLKNIIDAPARCPDGQTFISGRCRSLY